MLPTNILIYIFVFIYVFHVLVYCFICKRNDTYTKFVEKFKSKSHFNFVGKTDNLMGLTFDNIKFVNSINNAPKKNSFKIVNDWLT